MARTHWSGPLTPGDKHAGQSGGPNWGYAELVQTGAITRNSTNAVSVSFNLPPNSQIVDIIPDVTTAFDSATSATLTVGTAAGGSQYVSGVNAKTGGRAAPTISAAQAAAMAGIGTNTTVVATVTPSGATTAGAVRVTIRYVQVQGD